MAPSLAALPSELVAAILEHLPRPDLLALARTDRALRPHAQRRLFRLVAASPVRGNLAVVGILARAPHLAPFVRSFSLAIPGEPATDDHPDAGGGPDADGDAPPPEFYHALAEALQAMTGLTSLSLLIHPRASWVLTPRSKSGSAGQFSTLLKLACTFPLDEHLRGFLARTPALVELEIDSVSASSSVTNASPPVAQDCVPLLVSFTGLPASAAHLVPGRPVHTVQVLSPGPSPAVPAPTLAAADDASLALLGALARTTAPGGIELLSVSTGAPAVPFLKALALSLPRVAHLRVMTTYELDRAWDTDFYDRVADVLQTMPELATFELSGMHWPAQRASAGSAPRAWRSPLVGELPLPDIDHAQQQQHEDEHGLAALSAGVALLLTPHAHHHGQNANEDATAPPPPAGAWDFDDFYRYLD